MICAVHHFALDLLFDGCYAEAMAVMKPAFDRLPKGYDWKRA